MRFVKLENIKIYRPINIIAQSALDQEPSPQVIAVAADERVIQVEYGQLHSDSASEIKAA